MKIASPENIAMIFSYVLGAARSKGFEVGKISHSAVGWRYISFIPPWSKENKPRRVLVSYYHYPLETTIIKIMVASKAETLNISDPSFEDQLEELLWTGMHSSKI